MFFASVLLHTSSYFLLTAIAFAMKVTLTAGWWLYALMPLAALAHTTVGFFFLKTNRRTRAIGFIVSGLFLLVLAINIGVLYYALLTYMTQA